MIPARMKMQVPAISIAFRTYLMALAGHHAPKMVLTTARLVRQ
jgi:hypothetical protein